MDEEMDLIDRKIAQAEEQAAYWREQRVYAERQETMWAGALGALRDLRAEMTKDEAVGEEEAVG